VPFPCQKGGMGAEMRVLVRISPILCCQIGLGSNHTRQSKKKGGVKICPLRTWCVGLFAGQKWCISGNPGNTLPGHHLSVGSPSVYSQGMPCQVLWSGMLVRGGQRQLSF